MDFANNPLVTTDWLAEHLHDDLRIVDARWRGDGSSVARYRARHLPGAVHIDWHLHLAHTVDGVRDLLLPPDQFAAVMAAAGIGDETRVVAYAEADYSGAARLWWALRYYGHEQVALLDGGLDRWRAEGRPQETGDFTPAPAHFTPRPRPDLLATVDEIQAALQRRDPAVALVDTRPREQFLGQAVWTPAGSAYLEPGHDTIDIGGRAPFRAGHIPGAVHVNSSANMDSNTWTYLPPEQLKARAAAAGLRPEQRVITYCGVGASASLGLFALHLAGFRNVAVYEGSWEEWGTDEARPVERGE